MIQILQAISDMHSRHWLSMNIVVHLAQLSGKGVRTAQLICGKSGFRERIRTSVVDMTIKKLPMSL